MINLNRLDEIESLLRNAKSIAVVGLSPKPERPSNMVAQYLIEAGYTILPVNPGQEKILGLPCYPDLLSVPEKIDIVDIFRSSEHVLEIVQQSITVRCSAVWMQQGIINQEAAQIARDHGIPVIMDRCIKIDHANLFNNVRP